MTFRFSYKPGLFPAFNVSFRIFSNKAAISCLDLRRAGFFHRGKFINAVPGQAQFFGFSRLYPHDLSKESGFFSFLWKTYFAYESRRFG